MSVNKFKVGDKVRVSEGLKINQWYGGYLFTSFMSTLTDKADTVTGIHNDGDAYLLNDYDIGWTDEMLEPVENTLDDLCAGDLVSNSFGARKVLAAIDSCYLLSRTDKHTIASNWYTAAELKKMSYQILPPGDSITLIEINGKKYSKYDVEAAIKDLEPIDPSNTDS